MKNTALYSVLTEEDREYLQENMELKRFKKGEVIFTPLDRCDYLSVIIDGQIRLSKYSADGQEQILSFLSEDDVFGEAIVFEGNNYVVTVIAEKDSIVGMVHRDVLLTLTQRNREFTKAFFSELSRKIEILNNKIEMLSLKTMKQKIARFLLTLSKKQETIKIRLPYSKQKIAFLIGTSREVVSRNFSDLESEGYIVQKNNNIIVIDKNMLEDLLL